MMAGQQALPQDIKASTAAAYDAIAPAYLKFATEKPSDNLRMKWIHKLFLAIGDISDSSGKGIRFCELGCGAGIPVLKTLYDYHLEHKSGREESQHARIIGVDISRAQIELARELVLGNVGDKVSEENQSQNTDQTGVLELICSDMMSLSFPKGSLGAVVAFYSIFHLPREEQATMLQRIRVWLDQDGVDIYDAQSTTKSNTNRGGLLLLNMGSTDNQLSSADDWLDVKDSGRVYWSSFDADKNLSLVKEAGFEILESEVIKETELGHEVSFLWILAKAV